MMRLSNHCFCLLAAALGLQACSVPEPASPAAVVAAATEPSLRDRYSRSPQDWPAATIDAGVAFVELGPIEKSTQPADPQSTARVDLGKALFFDARISGSGHMACASCHDADLGFADGRTTSFGHGFQPLRRNAPSILNVGSLPTLFWDGRAKTLEDQALMVFENADEMHTSGGAIVETLSQSQGYRERFAAAYGDDAITLPRTLQAIAAFEATVRSDGSSAFDRFVAGDREAMDDDAILGLHLFRTKARCVNCHHGPLLTDHSFHDLGLSYYGRELEDLGRYRVTKDTKDVGRFKTPSLRNVTRTAPYMHNGLFDLAGVVNMYSAGMATLRKKAGQEGDPLFPTKSPLLKRLDLSVDEKRALIAFLHALEERRRRVRPPKLPRSAPHKPAVSMHGRLLLLATTSGV